MSDGVYAKPESASPPKSQCQQQPEVTRGPPDGRVTLHNALSYSGSSFHLSDGWIGPEGLGVLVASCSLTHPNSAKKATHTAYFLLLLKTR